MLSCMSVERMRYVHIPPLNSCLIAAYLVMSEMESMLIWSKYADDLMNYNRYTEPENSNLHGSTFETIISLQGHPMMGTEMVDLTV